MLYVVYNSCNVVEGVFTCESKANKACDSICGGYVCGYNKNTVDMMGIIVYHSKWQ